MVQISKYIFTKEQRARQLLANLIVFQGKECAEHYRMETRRLLERVRSGTASQEEIEMVAQAVKLLNTQAGYARLAYVLATHFLAPEKLTATEIAHIVHVDTRTIHRDIASGIEQLAILLFGVDALKWR